MTLVILLENPGHIRKLERTPLPNELAESTVGAYMVVECVTRHKTLWLTR